MYHKRSGSVDVMRFAEVVEQKEIPCSFDQYNIVEFDVVDGDVLRVWKCFPFLGNLRLTQLDGYYQWTAAAGFIRAQGLEIGDGWFLIKHVSNYFDLETQKKIYQVSYWAKNTATLEDRFICADVPPTLEEALKVIK